MLFCVVLVLTVPLLRRGLVPGHDWVYQLNRIQNIGNGLKLGLFPNKIHVFSFNGYGYGSGLFYPDFFLYLPATLMFLGLSLNVSYKLFLLLVIILLTCSSYFSGKYIFKSRLAGTLTAVFLVTSQTIVTNMYVRCALGETLATIFIPITIAALYNIVYEKFSKPHLLILAFTGLIYTHTITLFLTGLISLFIILVNMNKVFVLKKGGSRHNLNIILKTFFCIFVTLALSISYWMPMLEQFLDAKFYVNNSAYKVSNLLTDSTVDPRTLFLERNTVGSMFPIAFITVLLIGTLLGLNKKTNCLHQAKKFVIFGTVLASSTLNFFKKVWRILNCTAVTFIQFPWRLHVFAVVFLSLGIAGVLEFLTKNNEDKKHLVLILPIFSMLCCALSVRLISRSVIKSSSDITSYAIYGGNEWLPEDTDISKLTTPTTVYGENGSGIALNKKEGNKISFLSNGRSVYFDVPLLFYKGYSAYLLDKENKKYELKIDKSINNNLVRVFNENRLEGTIHVFYKGTKIQYLSYTVNTISFFVLIVYVLIEKLKKYKKINICAAEREVISV